MTDAGRKATLGRIERLLARIQEADPRHEAVIADIRQLVLALAATPRAVPAQRRTGEGTSYSVEGAGDTASLAEYRASGQPLRVAKHTYDVIVEVLGSAQRPLPFDEIMVNAAKKSGDAPADWQVRVVLRYLLRAEPPVLRRTRSRYHPVTPPGKFAGAASKWWRRAAKAG